MKNFVATFILLCLSALSAHATNINGQLEKAGAERLSSDPTGFNGRLYFNTSTELLKLYKTAGWKTLVDGVSSSVDAELALFAGTGGNTLQRATGTGLAQVTSGVYAALAASTQGNVARSNGTAWVSSAPSLISGTNASPNTDRMEHGRTSTTCTTGTCANVTQSGGATSVTYVATGNYNINWTGGTFTTAPTCVCSGSANAANVFCTVISTSTSTTNIQMYDAGNAAQNEQFRYICMGPR
jgi:hypothetical protein